jgi:hypothetical protein
MLAQKLQGQRVDPRVMMRRVGDEGLVVGVDGLAKRRILMLGGSVHLCRRQPWPAPARQPVLLLDAPEQCPAFGIARIVTGQLPHPFARLLEAAQATQADRLFLPAGLVISVDGQRQIELLERQLILLELEQGVAGGALGFTVQGADRRLVGEQQNVAGTVFLPRDFHSPIPAFMGVGKLVALGEQQLPPLRLFEIGNRLKTGLTLRRVELAMLASDHRRQAAQSAARVAGSGAPSRSV